MVHNGLSVLFTFVVRKRGDIIGSKVKRELKNGMAYEILGKNAPLALAGYKGEPGEKGEKGEKGLRGEAEYPRSIDFGPAFEDGVAPSAVDINVSPDNGDYESYAGWLTALKSGAISIDVTSPSGRYKSASLSVPRAKVLWYRYVIVGPGKISDVRLESGTDGFAVVTCQWDGLNGDIPAITYSALVVFEYIADDGRSFLVEDE